MILDAIIAAFRRVFTKPTPPTYVPARCYMCGESWKEPVDMASVVPHTMFDNYTLCPTCGCLAGVLDFSRTNHDQDHDDDEP